MVGVLLIAHGALAQSLVESAKMIMGDDIPNYRALQLEIGADLEQYKSDFLTAVRELNTGDGVLVLADLFAGTPANTALQNLRQEGYGLLTGANLAMVVEALSNRDGMTLEEVKEAALEAAKASMVDINQKLKGM
ncbi:MAG: PTS sugar transporter subunit IIA [Angelakisella sp.]|jgi:PTS system mannose-specific IIA component|nr:PTS sugar transporter subunit IIA [Angelakisella sp.]